jgi:hypothetical protein
MSATDSAATIAARGRRLERARFNEVIRSRFWLIHHLFGTSATFGSLRRPRIRDRFSSYRGEIVRAGVPRTAEKAEYRLMDAEAALLDGAP